MLSSLTIHRLLLSTSLRKPHTKNSHELATDITETCRKSIRQSLVVKNVYWEHHVMYLLYVVEIFPVLEQINILSWNRPSTIKKTVKNVSLSLSFSSFWEQYCDSPKVLLPNPVISFSIYLSVCEILGREQLWMHIALSIWMSSNMSLSMLLCNTYVIYCTQSWKIFALFSAVDKQQHEGCSRILPAYSSSSPVGFCPIHATSQKFPQLKLLCSSLVA